MANLAHTIFAPVSEAQFADGVNPFQIVNRGFDAPTQYLSQYRRLMRFCRVNTMSELSFIHARFDAVFGATRVRRLIALLTGRGFIAISNNRFISNGFCF